MKNEQPGSTDSWVVCKHTSRADEFRQFNQCVLEQADRTAYPYNQRIQFAKIYRNNVLEGIGKFPSGKPAPIISEGEIPLIVNQWKQTAPDPPWTKQHYSEVRLHSEQLLHFPYDNFNDLLLGIALEARNIKQIVLSIYRLARDSQVVKLLAMLLSVGVDVQVLIETGAKGNEQENIQYAHDLKLLGAKIIIPKAPYKNHAKFLYLTWMDNQTTTILFTGNLNENTAATYEDYAMITSSPPICEGMRNKIAELISGTKIGYQSSMIYFTKDTAITRLIQEINNQIKQGKDGYILIKCNLFTDPGMMGLLEYAASQGVQIELIVRGECCWKPISPNVTVHRFLHTYLEHSRIYLFGKTNPNVYLGSLDFATHKMFGRIECIWQITRHEQITAICLTLDNMTSDRTGRHYVLKSEGETHTYIPIQQESTDWRNRECQGYTPAPKMSIDC